MSASEALWTPFRLIWNVICFVFGFFGTLAALAIIVIISWQLYKLTM